VAVTICEWLPTVCNVNVLLTRDPKEVMYYIGVAHIAAFALTLIVLVLWVLRNGWNTSKMMLYGIYIYTLAVALFVGVCYHAYGVILFVLSDAIIGFRVPKLQALTYPLYYGSLLYFYYLV